HHDLLSLDDNRPRVRVAGRGVNALTNHHLVTFDGGMPAETAAAGARAAHPDSIPMVRLEGVRKSFGDNLVLDGIDLSVELGDVLVIIGPSGSGKSTLLRCVNLLEPI